jgi:hypothetical protein
VFKGSGFYRTDSRSGGGGVAAKSDSDKGDSGKGDSGKSESGSSSASTPAAAAS